VLTQISPFGGSEQIPVGGIAGGVGNTIQILEAGQPIHAFYVRPHIRDADGRPIRSQNEDEMYDGERRPYKSPAPDWILGHSSRFGLGNFDMNLSLRAHIGNYVYNNVASRLGHFRALTWGGAPNNLHRSVLYYGFEREQYFSDVYVEDASFLRMDNISVGYTFDPLRTGQRVRVFGTVQNVFTMTDYTGVDPEAGVNGIDNNLYPRSRTFTAGMDVRF
jgi:TonB-dependent starch-binding outer membrane protein SusC